MSVDYMQFVYAHSAIYHTMWHMQSTHQQGTNIKKEPSAVAFKTLKPSKPATFT